MSPVLTRAEAPFHGPDLEIGLVNNLSDMGLLTGERQIRDLLAGAFGGRRVHLRLTSLPSIQRGEAARAHIAARYTPFREFLCRPVDILFVTGCEPSADALPDEPFWPELVELIDWASEHSRAAVWSCLAAHAAVLHLDGVRRNRLTRKCSGLFAVDIVTPHALVNGVSAGMLVPHSRWNGLAADDLIAKGYQILTHSTDVGVDVFTKSRGSTFVFLQGHPEYDPGALLREYRRDVMRYLSGSSETYPGLLTNYFDAETEAALIAFAGEARRSRIPALAAALPTGAALPVDTRRFGHTLVSNLLHLAGMRIANHAA